MIAGMPKSNEGGSVVLYGIGGLANQQRCLSPHRSAPLLVGPTGSAAVAGLSRLQQHKIWPEAVSSNFHAYPMQLVFNMARGSWALSSAPGDSPDIVHMCWLNAATACFGALSVPVPSLISLGHSSPILRARDNEYVISRLASRIAGIPGKGKKRRFLGRRGAGQSLTIDLDRWTCRLWISRADEGTAPLFVMAPSFYTCAKNLDHVMSQDLEPGLRGADAGLLDRWQNTQSLGRFKAPSAKESHTAQGAIMAIPRHAGFW